MIRTLALLAALATACRTDPPAVTSAPSKIAMPTIQPSDQRITENSPSSLAGRQVVVFNIWERGYARADGSSTTPKTDRLGYVVLRPAP